MVRTPIVSPGSMTIEKTSGNNSKMLLTGPVEQMLNKSHWLLDQPLHLCINNADNIPKAVKLRKNC
jgi:hypothetical protein